MRSLRNFVRFLVAVQLLPALESGEETLVGGQAVLEGVMMRSPHAWAIACRKPSGEVVTMSEPLERPSEKHKWMAWPIVRGVMTLGYAMSLGYRALRFSANVAIEEVMQDEDATRPCGGSSRLEHVALEAWSEAAELTAAAGLQSVPRESRRHQRMAGRRQHHHLAGLLHLHVQVPAAAGGDGTQEIRIPRWAARSCSIWSMARSA